MRSHSDLPLNNMESVDSVPPPFNKGLNQYVAGCTLKEAYEWPEVGCINQCLCHSR